MASDALKKAAIQQRMLFRQSIYYIWGMVKSDRRDELSEKENNFAEILMDHEEYSDHFENIEILDGREYDAGAMFNPFLHISTHQMVEDQLSANLPVQATSLYAALGGKGFSHHEAVHVIAMILVHVMHASALGKCPFEAARYKRLLIKCSAAEPSEIEKIIEEDLSSYTTCH